MRCSVVPYKITLRLCYGCLYVSKLGVTNGLCEHSRECEHCDFFASTSRDKKFALRAASSEHLLYRNNVLVSEQPLLEES